MKLEKMDSPLKTLYIDCFDILRARLHRMPTDEEVEAEMKRRRPDLMRDS